MPHAQETGIELLSPTFDGPDPIAAALLDMVQQVDDDVHFTFSGV